MSVTAQLALALVLWCVGVVCSVGGISQKFFTDPHRQLALGALCLCAYFLTFPLIFWT